MKNYIENFGVDQKYAEETWKEIENMADYQFNKSHAVAYANTGYACQWLKVNYPLAFWSVAFSYADDDDFPVYLHEINEIGNIKVIPLILMNRRIRSRQISLIKVWCGQSHQ